MKKIFALMLCLFLSFGLFGCEKDPADGTDPSSDSTASDDVVPAEPEQHYLGLTDQKNSRLVVYDLDVEDWSSEEAVIWEFSNPLTRIASGIKLRNSDFWGGDVVIFCSSSGGIGIVSYDTKELLWYTTSGPNNPHSVELLPNGNLVCAASSGNTVRIYATSQRTLINCYYSDVTFRDAHGVLWDPTLELLWVYGGERLAAYRVVGTDAQPALEPVEGMSYLVPGGTGHDLAPVYGNPDRLWVTGGGGVKQFVKSTGEFVVDFPGAFLTDVKGVGNFRDGRVAFTAPNKNFYDWTTDNVYSFGIDEGGAVVDSYTRTQSDDAYYKARIWISDYQ